MVGEGSPVMAASTRTPNRSSPLRTATRPPDSANTKMPSRSSTVRTTPASVAGSGMDGTLLRGHLRPGPGRGADYRLRARP